MKASNVISSNSLLKKQSILQEGHVKLKEGMVKNKCSKNSTYLVLFSSKDNSHEHIAFMESYTSYLPVFVETFT